MSQRRRKQIAKLSSKKAIRATQAEVKEIRQRSALEYRVQSHETLNEVAQLKQVTQSVKLERAREARLHRADAKKKVS